MNFTTIFARRTLFSDGNKRLSLLPSKTRGRCTINFPWAFCLEIRRFLTLICITASRIRYHLSALTSRGAVIQTTSRWAIVSEEDINDLILRQQGWTIEIVEVTWVKNNFHLSQGYVSLLRCKSDWTHAARMNQISSIDRIGYHNYTANFIARKKNVWW